MNRRKIAWVSFATALVMTSSLWLLWWASNDPARSLINDIIFPLFMPAFIVAMLVSGHSHGPNQLAWFLAQVIQLFFLIFLIGYGIGIARDLRRRKEKN